MKSYGRLSILAGISFMYPKTVYFGGILKSLKDCSWNFVHI